MAAPVDRHLQSVPGDIDDREISKYVQFDPDSGQWRRGQRLGSGVQTAVAVHLPACAVRWLRRHPELHQVGVLAHAGHRRRRRDPGQLALHRERHVVLRERPVLGRVAYNYRDTYLKEQFGPGNNQIYVEGQGRVNLSTGYKFDNGVSFTLNVANLTEEHRYEYSGQIDRVMLYQLEGRVITAGLNYTF